MPTDLWSVVSRACAGLVPVLGLLLCLSATLWVYWPGQAGGYILDDQSSLLPLAALASSPELLPDYVYGERSGRLGRAVSMYTFALEQVFTDGSIATVKRHSILLHLLTGVVVFWFSYLLCRAQNYRGPEWLALLAASLWLLAPQQTSTVLYAVQRMALLSALFTLLALVCYLKARQALGSSRSVWFWGGLCLMFTAIAPFVKENGILTVPLILVVEATFMRGRLVHGRVMPLLKVGSWILVVAGAFLLMTYFVINLDSLQNSFQRRSFTLWERLLTQPRILWDYVRQFYWPEMARMGLYHDDYPVSTALRMPFSTVVALVSWGLLLAAALVLTYFGLAHWMAGVLLFFLAGHGLESSFIALELYFEHRNYLPSVMLALLPVLVVGEIGRRWSVLIAPLLAWVLILVLLLALKTISQVQIWSSPTLLALHHFNGHPESVRANNDMATRLARLGDFDAARVYSLAAFAFSQTHSAARLEREGDLHLRNIALACMARAPLPAADLQALGVKRPDRPIGDTNTVEVVLKLYRDKQCPELDWHVLADRMHSIYLSDPLPGRASVGVYTAMSALMNALERIEEATQYSELALALAPQNTMLLFMQLHYVTLLGRTSEAEVIKQKLLSLQAEGVLTVAEEKNLAIYTQASQ